MAYTKEESLIFVNKCIDIIKNSESDAIIKYFLPDEVVVSDDCLTVDIYVTVQKNMNVIGSTHGAFVAGFLDYWMGVSARIFGGINHETTGMTTADYQLNFLRATKEGDKLQCHVECCHVGKRTVVTRAIIYC